MPRRSYSPQAIHNRAMKRGQAKADDEYYAGLAKKRHEAEENAAAAQAQPKTEGEKKNG